MALNAAAMSAMTLVAPAIGGGLYAFAGPHNVYFVIAGLAVVSFVFTSFLPKVEGGTSKKKGPTPQARQSFRWLLGLSSLPGT